jgi:hypothetical protein
MNCFVFSALLIGCFPLKEQKYTDWYYLANLFLFTCYILCEEGAAQFFCIFEIGERLGRLMIGIQLNSSPLAKNKGRLWWRFVVSGILQKIK